jgi:hypothetical protein
MKYMTKIFQVVPTIGVLVFLFYMTCIKSPDDFRKAPVSFCAFDTAEISGRLQYIGDQNHGDYFRTVKDPPERYYSALLVELVPTVSHGLWYEAHLGDSIVKHRFSNTLMLFRKDAISYYKIVTPQQK